MEIIDPTRIYQVKGEVCRLLCSPFAGGVANNQTVVTAVTAKRIRIMGWAAQGDAGVSTMRLKSASGGSTIIGPFSVPSSAGGTSDKLPITDSGYAETNTGEGLFVDVTVVGLVLSLFYIAYAPG